MATTTRFDAMTDAAGSRATVEGECVTTTTTIDSDTIRAAEKVLLRKKRGEILALMDAQSLLLAGTSALTDAEREICELMGIDPADYVRRRDAASAAEAVRVSGCPLRENEPSGRCADETAPSQGADPAAGSQGRSEVHDTNRIGEMRSMHPNQIHFIDSRLVAGHRMVALDMGATLIRWFVVDHYSGAFWVDYTVADGENAPELPSVLLDAWTPKADPARYPFHGVPFMLGLDCGAANTNHALRRLCNRLGVQLTLRPPYNGRAFGVVEGLHALWQRRFECELLLKPAESLEDLRARARDRALFLNNERHSRHGRTRFGMWMSIKPDHLRIMPPLEHCQALATGKPKQRTPDERLRIKVGGAEYQLSAPARKGQPVWIDRNPWQVGEWNAWIEVEGYGREPVVCRRVVRLGCGAERRQVE